MIVISKHIIFACRKMTHNKLTMVKGSDITILCHTVHSSKHIRKKYPNTERGQRLKNSVFLCQKMKKTRQKEAGCIIFNHQYFWDGDAPIELFTLEQFF